MLTMGKPTPHCHILALRLKQMTVSLHLINTSPYVITIHISEECVATSDCSHRDNMIQIPAEDIDEKNSKPKPPQFHSQQPGIAHSIVPP